MLRIRYRSSYLLRQLSGPRVQLADLVHDVAGDERDDEEHVPPGKVEGVAVDHGGPVGELASDDGTHGDCKKHDRHRAEPGERVLLGFSLTLRVWKI